MDAFIQFTVRLQFHRSLGVVTTEPPDSEKSKETNHTESHDGNRQAAFIAFIRENPKLACPKVGASVIREQAQAHAARTWAPQLCSIA